MTSKFPTFTWHAKDSDHIFTIRRRPSMARVAVSNAINRERPKPPIIKLSNGAFTENMADPEYLERVNLFNQFSGVEALVFGLSAIVENPTPEEVEEIIEMMGGLDIKENHIKMLWLQQQLSDSDFTDLCTASLEMNEVTEEGINDASADFRGDDQQRTRAQVRQSGKTRP